MAQVLQEIDFCKSQIKKYSELYESLLVRYNSMIDAHTPLNMKFNPNVFKPAAVLPLQTSESESESESESSSDEFTKAVSNYITNGSNQKLNVDASVKKVNFAQKETLKETPEFLLDDIESLVQPESNKKQIQLKSKEDEEDFKRLEKKKYDARAGLKEHEEKLSKIYAEEKRLLDQGLNPEEVRKRVRELYYPEAIPKNERKTPAINVNVLDKNGKYVSKSVDLLAFDEDYLEDDEPNQTSVMDPPTIEEAEEENDYKNLDEKIQMLLNGEYNEEDVVE
jgi:hypothetical protein